MTKILTTAAVGLAVALVLVSCGDDGGTDEADDVNAYCDMSAEIEASEEAPTDEQLDAIVEAAPDEIKDAAETFAAAIKADEDFSPEDLEAEQAIRTFEEENCGDGE